MTAGQLRLGKGTAPAPSANEGTLYFDSADDQLYVIDSAGNTVGPITGGGGGGLTDGDFVPSAPAISSGQVERFVRTGPFTHGIIQDNLAAAGPPAGADNTAAGYSPSSIWVDQNTNRTWVAAGEDAGLMIWREVTSDATQLRGEDLSTSTPNNGDVLTYNGGVSKWEPAAPAGGAPSGAAGGDLGGNYPNPDVVALQGTAVAAGTPNNYDVLSYNAGTTQWEPTNRTVGPANAIYMATNGSDLTGRRGDPSRPFLTLQAAADTAVTGDTIYVGPGIFDTNSTPGAVFNWPDGVASLSIVGAGPVKNSNLYPLGCGTLIQNTSSSGSLPAGAPMIEVTPANAGPSGFNITGFRLENLSLSYPFNNGTRSVLSVKDTGIPVVDTGLFMFGDGLILRNISVINSGIGGGFALSASYALDANNVCKYIFENVDFTLKDVRLINCREQGGGSGGSRVQNLRARYLGVKLDSADAGFPGPLTSGVFGGNETQTFSNCVFDNAYLSGQARVRFDKLCRVGGLGSLLFLGPLSYNSAAPAFVPSIEFYGKADTVSFPAAQGIPDVTGALNPNLLLDFSGAGVTQSLVIEGTAGTAQRQKVRANGLAVAIDPLVPATQINIGEGIDYFDRYLNLMHGDVRTNTGGTIAPGVWTKEITSVGGTDTVNFLGSSGGAITTFAAPIGAQAIGQATAQAPFAVSSLTPTAMTVLSSSLAGNKIYVAAFWNSIY